MNRFLFVMAHIQQFHSAHSTIMNELDRWSSRHLYLKKATVSAWFKAIFP
jgi:hypothetical protein